MTTDHDPIDPAPTTSNPLDPAKVLADTQRQVTNALAAVRAALAGAREERDRINDRIKDLVEQERTLHRTAGFVHRSDP